MSGKRYALRALRFCVSILFSILFAGCVSDRILHQHLVNCPPITDERFDGALHELTGITFQDGNRVTELVNGEEFFPAMIDAIRNAQKTIHFENFVWRSGEISTRFIDELSERARAGIKVLFLVDALGAAKVLAEDWEKLRVAGVVVTKYNPPSLINLFSISHRTHRKILIVDGKIGFIGGISIADEWLCDTDNPGRWRDSNYRIEGMAVPQLENIFAVNWRQATKRTFQPEEVFSSCYSPRCCKAACFMSGPGENEKSARRTLLFCIAAAQKNIRIAHSYFIPDNLMMNLLLDARKRGVKIEILTPGVVNLNFVRRASRSRWKKLLDAGVEFYEYQPTKYHLKLMIVDDLWVTAGSINFDERSFRINDEANFIARDHEFAVTQIATFETDKRFSRRVDVEQFSGRPWQTKVVEHFFGLFRFEL